MANVYERGTALDYPQVHNNREKKVIETSLTSWSSHGTVEFAAAAADYAMTDTDGYHTVIVNDAITVTLPAAATNVGRRILFLQKGAATLTVAQNADDANIAGADANYTAMDAANDRAELISDGTEWLLVNSTIA